MGRTASRAEEGEMRQAWRKDPWKFFWFKPDEAAGAARAQPEWADLLSRAKACAMCRDYSVLVRTLMAEPFGEVAHLYIWRNDDRTNRSWTDFQRIKNAICGEDFTAVEVYPPEDELVDEANIWHLWCLPAGVRMPFWIGNARDEDVVWTFPGLEDGR